MYLKEHLYSVPYERRSPYHRLTPQDLEKLDADATCISRFPPIYLVVYHMATQEKYGIPDHDVYVNTKEMKYCVERHDQPLCLVEEQNKPAGADYIPCECNEVHCRKCDAPFMAATSRCLEINSCNMTECEYCTHLREVCAAEEFKNEIISRASKWYKEPDHQTQKTGYHKMLDSRKGHTRLNLAECYAIAITEVFHQGTPVLHPLVKKLLDVEGMECSKLLGKENLHWVFDDRSFLEQDDWVLRATSVEAPEIT